MIRYLANTQNDHRDSCKISINTPLLFLSIIKNMKHPANLHVVLAQGSCESRKYSIFSRCAAEASTTSFNVFILFRLAQSGLGLSGLRAAELGQGSVTLMSLRTLQALRLAINLSD